MGIVVLVVTCALVVESASRCKATGDCPMQPGRGGPPGPVPTQGPLPLFPTWPLGAQGQHPSSEQNQVDGQLSMLEPQAGARFLSPYHNPAARPASVYEDALLSGTGLDISRPHRL